MKLILATSPHVRHVAVLQGDFQPDPTVMYSFAPVGLLSLAAVLRRDRPDIECEIYDVNRRILSGEIPLDEGFYGRIAGELIAASPFAVGLMTECDSYHHILQICAAIKALSPGCFVILGGPHASAVASETMWKCPAVDAIVIGEGESTIAELLDVLGTGAAVAGAHTRDAHGSPIDGGARDLVPDLDDLPIPAYDMHSADPGEEIFVEVGRGCPFKCTFCSTAPYWRRRHRTKSAGRITAEIELVHDLFGTTRVHFTHDLFTAHRNWVVEVCEALIAASLPVEWTCSARTDTVDPELLALMKRAGCSAIYFGIESGSERVLGEIKKAISLQESFTALGHCQAAGITPIVGFIVGFPTEDARSFAETFAAWERALREGCKPAHIFGFCPFADSAIFPTLTNLECAGHFIDLPLGPGADARNRTLVASDPELFGSWFRPALPDLLEGSIDAIEGADEFSPLVEAMLAPALALADLMGGMSHLFGEWLEWIRERNDARGAARNRRSYGAPTDFAEFLVETLATCFPEAAGALAAAKLLRANLCARALPMATTIANYRSLPMAQPELVSLKSNIRAQSVTAMLALDFDPSSALDTPLATGFPEEPSYFVWHAADNGDLRLLRVSEDVHDLVACVRMTPRRVSDLVLESLTADGAPRGAEEILNTVRAAAGQGLITLGE